MRTRALLGCLLATILCCCSSALAQSANNDCANAIPMFDGDVVAYNTSGDTNDGPTPTCGGGTAPIDIWFEFDNTLGMDGTLALDFCGGNTLYDSRVVVYEGGCGALVQIACNDDSCGLQSAIAAPVAAGGVYQIQVCGFNAAAGAGEFTVAFIPPLCNDTCVPPAMCPMVLPNLMDGPNAITTISAATDGPTIDITPCTWAGADGQVYNDVWFTYVATTTGTTRFSTCNTVPWDSRIVAWDNSAVSTCPPDSVVDVPLGCDDDGNGAGCANFSSQLDIPTTTGVTYLIRVGGFFEGSTGSGTLNVIPEMPEACGDGLDNDLDGLTDCDDVIDCALSCVYPAENVICDNLMEPMGMPATFDVSWTANPLGLAASQFRIFENGVETGAVPGTTTMISITAPLGSSGPYEVCIQAEDTASGQVAAQSCCSIGAPPPACCFAPPVAIGSPAATGNLTGNAGLGTSSCGASSGNPEACFDFTAPSDGTYVFSTCGTHDGPGQDLGMDTVINAFDSCGGTELACDDDAGPPPCPGTDTGILRDSVISLVLTAGQSVKVRVSHFGGVIANGDYILNIEQLVSPPENLVCTPDFLPPMLATQIDATWTAPTGGPTVTGWNVYVDGAFATSLPLGTTMYTDVLPVGYTGIREICIESDAGGVVSSQTCCQVSVSNLMNDDCANAEVVTLGATPYDTTLATNSGVPGSTIPCNGAVGQFSKDVWFEFTPATSNDYLIDTCAGGSFDTDMLIYSGTCGALFEEACSGDGTGLVGCQIFYSGLSVPLTAGTPYLIRVGGFGATTGGTGTLNIGLDCGGVDPVMCAYDCTTDNLDITWTDNALATVGYNIFENGVMVGSVLAGTTMFTLNAPTVGTNTYTVEWDCSLGGPGNAGSCTITISSPVVVPSGTQDLVLHQEGLQDGGALGDVDSGVELENALAANGRNVFRVGIPNFDALDAAGCLSGIAGGGAPTIETLWVCTGTFANDYRITQAEGDLLDAWAATGINIYFEGGDHWGFIHTDSAIDGRDGIEEDIGANIVDGDDSFTQMDGVNAPIAGLDLSANVDVDYMQDQVGTDWTDQLATTGTTGGAIGDAMITSAEAIWTNSDDGIPIPGDPDEVTPYITGVIAIHTDGGKMISQSWEFGGYASTSADPAAARAALAGEYLAALDRVGGGGDDFKRGDCNNDDSFNIADAVYLLGNLFPGPMGPNALNCRDACDGNDDGSLNIADAVALLAALFTPPSGPAPLPTPGSMACGPDPTVDMLDCTAGVCP